MDTPSNTKVWDTRRRRKEQKLQSVQRNGKIINTEDTVSMLEKLLSPGSKVVLEGNNQKQADFLGRMLAEVNPDVVQDLHMKKIRLFLLGRSKSPHFSAS